MTAPVLQVSEPKPHPLKQQSLAIPVVKIVDEEPAVSPQGSKYLETPQSSVNTLGVPLMSPDMKRVAKELIEKHTIENVSLENRLRENENNALKKMYAKIEEKRAKVSHYNYICVHVYCPSYFLHSFPFCANAKVKENSSVYRNCCIANKTKKN